MVSKAEVIIGQPGSVEGDIQARRVLVSGRFEGTIRAERLEIVASGRVSGEVSVSQLVIESGGQFDGTSRLRSEEAPRQITHDRAAAMAEIDATAAGASKTAAAASGN